MSGAMNLGVIALSNLRRRKARALFLLVGLAIGVATVVALVAITQSLSGQTEARLQSDGANILITPPSESVSLSYGGLSVGGMTVGARSLDQRRLDAIDSIRDRETITGVAPELVGPVRVGSERLLLMGVLPEEEFALKRWWSVDRGRPLRGTRELVAGWTAAQRLGLAMGDYVEIGGRRFTTTGILRETGSQDDDLLIVDLRAAQRILDRRGQVTLVEIAARYGEVPVDRVVEQLAAALPGTRVTEVQQAVRSRSHALAEFRSFSYAIVGVVIAIEALVVFLTMMGSVNERTNEIGIFRAIGFRRGHVTRLVLIEAFVISALAGVAGYIVGMGTVYAVLPFVATAAEVLWTPLLGLLAVGLSIGIGVLASLSPARTAGRLDPTEALRAL
jgi:putative ABC transport system permease protein